MKHRESALEAWAVKWARFRGIITAKLMHCDGIPDRIFFMPGGAPVIVEFKAKGEVPDELQTWYLITLQKYGYHVAFCPTKESFLEVIQCKMKK